MVFSKALKKVLMEYCQRRRWENVNGLLDPNGKTLLDIGCRDLFVYNKLKDKYEITLVDCALTNKLILEGDIQNLSFPDKSFDIVLCQQVLEHVFDPVKAISELKRITRRQLVITLPNEPFFTFFRLLSWEKEHLWAITPGVLRVYLGDPVYEREIFFKRYYVGVWNLA
jgi:SAM-dependent methyltransferase